MSKILKIAAIVTLVSLLVVVSAGCKNAPAPWETMALSAIISDPIRINIPVNATSNLTISAMYSKISAGEITTGSGGFKVVTNNLTFKSSNEAIAVVKGGLVRGLTAGSGNISVFYSECNITKKTDVPFTITAPPGT